MSSGWDYVAKIEAELANENAIVRRMNVEELDFKTRIRKLEAARVHDVDEKAWLSKRMSAFKTALEFIRDDKIPQGMPASMFADRVLAQSETDGEAK